MTRLPTYEIEIAELVLEAFDPADSIAVAEGIRSAVEGSLAERALLIPDRYERESTSGDAGEVGVELRSHSGHIGESVAAAVLESLDR